SRSWSAGSSSARRARSTSSRTGSRALTPSCPAPKQYSRLAPSPETSGEPSGLELDAARQRAVHHQVGAADPTGDRAGQEDHRARDVLGRAQVPGRVESDRRLEQLRVAALDAGPDPALEVGVPRGDGVGADALRRELEREAVDVADDRGLGRAVGP